MTVLLRDWKELVFAFAKNIKKMKVHTFEAWQRGEFSGSSNESTGLAPSSTNNSTISILPPLKSYQR